MSVRMLTRDLLSLLNDLVLTATLEPGLSGCAGILLHSSRVDEGLEPGAGGVLVGTSTNGVVIGHCWVEASGNLPPTLLPIQYVQALRVGFGKLINKDNKETHYSEIRRDGDQIVIAEDPDLFGGGFSQQFAYGDLDDWPRSVFGLLGEVHLVAPTDRKQVENRTDYGSDRILPFVTISARHGGRLSMYRVHQSMNVHVQVGFHYRGLLVPSGQWNDGDLCDGAGPEIGVYPADLPPIKVPEGAEPEPALV